MASVKVLSHLVAERIAAGEVIERPASVIKELVENSIDAGATEVEVRIRRGGIESIRVTDNGAGMSASDLSLALLRHATSKIESIEDLDHLTTLGFRGEALPSIAAVSELKVVSKQKNSPQTFEIEANNEAPSIRSPAESRSKSFLGADHGTQVDANHLFSKIPARLKFLKSAASELTQIREILERLSLIHPNISFRFWADDREIFHLKKTQSLKERFLQIENHDSPFDVVEVNLEGPYSLELVWLKGMSISNTRSLYQLVNGRSIRDRILQSALLSPLKQSFLPGQFPVLVAKIQTPPNQVDVNAHPAKLEIRFAEPQKIYALCDEALKRALAGSTPQAYSPPTQTNGAELSAVFSDQPRLIQTQFSESTSTSFEISPFGTFRGVLFATYLIFEKNDLFYLLDQHACDERIRFEKLKAALLKQAQMTSQQLLIPEVVKLKEGLLRSLSSALKKNRLELLSKAGFEADLLSEDALVFRSIPSIWGNHALQVRLKGLCDRLFDEVLKQNEMLFWDESLFEKVAMESCRSAIKAHDYLHAHDANQLALELSKCEHPGNCPHGRPSWIIIKRTKLEEWFLRQAPGGSIT